MSARQPQKGSGQVGKSKTLPTLEYRLLIAPRYNEREQRYKTLILLETIQVFSTFRYEISVREELSDHTLHLTILGLKAPRLSLPASGHAHFSREYDNLRGTYEVTIEGLDGRTNTFSLRITQNQVSLLKAPSKKFVEAVVDESRWRSL